MPEKLSKTKNFNFSYTRIPDLYYIPRTWAECNGSAPRYTNNYALEVELDHSRGDKVLEWDGDYPPWHDAYIPPCSVEMFIVKGKIRVATCKNLLADFKNLNRVDLHGLDTSSVTDMSYMFADCRSLTSLDLSMLDVSSVEDMRSMFCGCQNLTSLNVGNWSVSKVIDMSRMFDNCTSLTSLYVGKSEDFQENRR